ncbi:hypothetical protein SERLADRAFT_467999, partial [Serpula lacrymans var. lacrymans S7.9]
LPFISCFSSWYHTSTATSSPTHPTHSPLLNPAHSLFGPDPRPDSGSPLPGCLAHTPTPLHKPLSSLTAPHSLSFFPFSLTCPATPLFLARSCVEPLLCIPRHLLLLLVLLLLPHSQYPTFHFR